VTASDFNPTSSDLICLAYLSSAAAPMPPEGLEDLVRASARNNAQRSVTGMLCYYDGSFLQFLEGPRSDVEATLAVIIKDVRHIDLIEMYRKPISHRVFADWSMALTHGDRLGADEQHLLRNLRQFDWSQDDAASHQPALEALFDTFRAWLR
jgi:hypothetical protein